MKFQKIFVGGYHVCGISAGVNTRTVCWGRCLNIVEQNSLLEEARDKTTKIGIKLYSWDELFYRGKENPSNIPSPRAHDICIVIYTSGTCGAPKCVVILLENIVALVNSLCFFMKQFEDMMIVEKLLRDTCCVLVCQRYGLTQTIGPTTLGFNS